MTGIRKIIERSVHHKDASSCSSKGFSSGARGQLVAAGPVCVRAITTAAAGREPITAPGTCTGRGPPAAADVEEVQSTERALACQDPPPHRPPLQHHSLLD